MFKRLANPKPLALCAFAVTTMVLTMHTAGIGIPENSPNQIVVGLCMFYGGMTQFIAGLINFIDGTPFDATSFCSFGAFWMSYGAIMIPWFGVAGGWDTNGNVTRRHSTGIFLLAWTVFMFIVMVASYRQHLGVAFMLTCLFLTFLLLCIGEWREHSRFLKAGGAFGFITSIIAFYLAATYMINADHGFIDLINVDLRPKHKRAQEGGEA
ncbi:Ammonia transport outward protein 2 [Smittium mucronatum]|uniref:Ammonia transport outward protein 2 n=1 Tax=Smittium mucronatum TaxID=133383 RepID=A0A1R0GZ08_9FUNG|nr:Ammonia transport outward protein 2 [Smittium mucronatum]